MGNTNTKESRSGDASGSGSSSHRHHQNSLPPLLDSSVSSSRDRPSSTHRSRNRASRSDLGSLLGINVASSTSRPDPPHERRETRQEREARRLERERIQRVQEREKSIREEHVDGGYLVTMGVYVGVEDYGKQVVRQLQIERKMAPFWRGLNDFNEQWAEHQIIAAARGLPIPPADQTPPNELIARPLSSFASFAASAQNLNTLTVPMGPRTLSVASDRSASNLSSALPSPTGPSHKGPASPFKPRTKALVAALSLGSRNASSAELSPRETILPIDPFVNGQPLEVFLYKNGNECPICFLYYPPYLNHTRCCDQPICSECFVQIKRPDPHFPEGHGDQPDVNLEEQAGLLIAEPAQCPYCQQPEFGVTYNPPPFRRGLAYAIPPAGLGSVGTAMSSTSSLNSTLSPTLASPPAPGASATAIESRRRTQSLSANAPNVITTDRVRPDWAAKLAAQRNHQARRAAAATALHTAAFLVGDSGSRPFGRMSRFGRRNTNVESSNTSGPNPGSSSSPAGVASAGPEPGPRSSSGRGLLIGPVTERRQSHMENLENMMLAEAIRLSLAVEEDRKRKAEKEEKRESKKKEKEERKASKAAKAATKGNPYSGTGHDSASGSALSLSSLGATGRKRGNSIASNMRVEATAANALASAESSQSPPGVAVMATPTDKGKAVDRGKAGQQPSNESGREKCDVHAPLHPHNIAALTPTSTAPAASEPWSPTRSSPPQQPQQEDQQEQQQEQQQQQQASYQPSYQPPTHKNECVRSSHLCHISSASSTSVSEADCQGAGCHQNSSCLHQEDLRADGPSIGRECAVSDGKGGGESVQQDQDPSVSTEPIFNFRSLAEMVGVEVDGVNAGRRLSQIGGGRAEDDSSRAGTGVGADDDADKQSSIHEASAEHAKHVWISHSDEADHDNLPNSIATLTQKSQKSKERAEQREDGGSLSDVTRASQVIMTPNRSMLEADNGVDSKYLGFRRSSTVEIPGEITPMTIR